jgi:2-deoxy-D-gluconate 3-dehydrogenase
MGLFNLKGKTVLITGTNTGLGQAMAIAFAKEGANVCGVARKEQNETKEECLKYSDFLDIRCDLSEFDSLETIFNLAEDKFGHVDILINNAGIIKRSDSISVTVKEYDDVINLNQKLVFFMCQRFAKKLFELNIGGKIINIASMLSYQGGFRVSSYAQSKHAIEGLTKSLCNEWAIKNININAIAPGYMETNNTKQIREDRVREAEILARIPQGRWGKPSDIAGTALFLASSASDYINGFTIAVDGGWLAR